MILAWARSHRRSLLMLVLFAVAAGVFTALRLPVAIFPDIAFPRLVVAIDSGDRPSSRMMIEVTQPAEVAVRTVYGVRSIRSTTSRGSTELSVNFGWGTDMVSAVLQVEAAINRILPKLPAGTTFQVRAMNPTVFPVYGLALTSNRGDPVALRDFARFDLRPELQLVDGVAGVEVLGGRTPEFHVEIDPARLRSLGLSISDVVTTLSGTNTVTAVGRLEDHYRLYLVLAAAPLRTAADIRRTIVRSGPDGVLHLGDIASVTRATVPEWTSVTANGRDAVLVNIYQRPGANTVAIARGVQRHLKYFAAHIPKDVHVATYYDQSALVLASAKSVRDAIAVGAVLAAVVLFLFLWNWRITLIIAIALPAVLAITVLMLKLLNLRFDMMTLGGMAAAVGLVVDDGVVMLEHIARRVAEAHGEHVHEAVGRGAMEMSQPLLGSSVATVIIFLPLAFLTGVTGGFFKALAMTMASALFISYFIAMFAMPIVADVVLATAPTRTRKHRLLHWLQERYRSAAHWFFGRALLLALVVAALAGAGYLAFRQVGTGFMPAMDEGGFILDYVAPPGTSLTETNRLLGKVEGIIRSTPDVDSYSRRTGLQLGGGITETNSGDFFIHLKPQSQRRPIEEVMSEVRRKVEHDVPSLRIETAQLLEDLIGDLTAVPEPVEVKLFGDDVAQLQSLAPKIRNAVASVHGVVEVKDGVVIAGDSLDLEIDRVKAALEGLDAKQITNQLDAEIGGKVASVIPSDQQLVGIRVRLPGDLRARVDQLGDLPLHAPDGHYVPFRRVGSIRIVPGEAEITRENGKPMVAVTGRIEGRDLGSTMRDVQAAVAKLRLPAGVSVDYGGLYREQQKSSRDLLIVFVSAVLLVFLLLLFLYERFTVALAIVATTLLSLTGVFAGLWITGTERNISAMMGMTMVVGMITEIAVFYFAELGDEDPGNSEALAQAGVKRMRAIIMSATIAVLALLPLALGLGAGSAMQKPLAIAIISGLVVAVPLVLLVMPAIYQTVGHLRLPWRSRTS